MTSLSQRIECPITVRVIRSIVKKALSLDLLVSVNDGECWEIERSSSFEKIIAECGHTGEVYFRFRSKEPCQKVGWVQIMLRHGVDCIADYSVNDVTEAIVKEAKDYCEARAI